MIFFLKKNKIVRFISYFPPFANKSVNTIVTSRKMLDTRDWDKFKLNR